MTRPNDIQQKKKKKKKEKKEKKRETLESWTCLADRPLSKIERKRKDR